MLTMPTMLKKDADAYDRMLDAAARLATLIESGGIEIDEAIAGKHPFKQEEILAMEAVLPDGTVANW